MENPKPILTIVSRKIVNAQLCLYNDGKKYNNDSRNSVVIREWCDYSRSHVILYICRLLGFYIKIQIFDRKIDLSSRKVRRKPLLFYSNG